MPEPLELAVRLLIDSSRQLQASMTRFVALNGALLAIVAAIMGWANFADYQQSLMWVVAATCGFAALGSWLVGGALLRQARWSRALRDRIRELQHESQPILPKEERATGAAYGDAFVQAARWLAVALWIALLAEILVTLPKDEEGGYDTQTRRTSIAADPSVQAERKIAPRRSRG